MYELEDIYEIDVVTDPGHTFVEFVNGHIWCSCDSTGPIAR